MEDDGDEDADVHAPQDGLPHGEGEREPRAPVVEGDEEVESQREADHRREEVEGAVEGVFHLQDELADADEQAVGDDARNHGSVEPGQNYVQHHLPMDGLQTLAHKSHTQHTSNTGVRT